MNPSKPRFTIYKKSKKQPGIVGHTGGFSASLVYKVLGQPGMYKEKPSPGDGMGLGSSKKLMVLVKPK